MYGSRSVARGARASPRLVAGRPSPASGLGGVEGLVGPLQEIPPGVFAAGDVRHRSVKQVASAVGVGAVGVAQVPEHLDRESGGAR